MRDARTLSPPQNGPLVFRPDTENPGVLHARRLYRDLIAKRLREMAGLEFAFNRDGDLVCLNPPD
ncbi:MAG: hypothetical protein AAB554_03365 [Patescibacteria group bacterium]